MFDPRPVPHQSVPPCGAMWGRNRPNNTRVWWRLGSDGRLSSHALLLWSGQQLPHQHFKLWYSSAGANLVFCKQNRIKWKRNRSVFLSYLLLCVLSVRQPPRRRPADCRENLWVSGCCPVSNQQLPSELREVEGVVLVNLEKRALKLVRRERLSCSSLYSCVWPVGFMCSAGPQCQPGSSNNFHVFAGAGIRAPGRRRGFHMRENVRRQRSRGSNPRPCGHKLVSISFGYIS